LSSGLVCAFAASPNWLMSASALSAGVLAGGGGVTGRALAMFAPMP
jgi:hypothetical protein